jgi:hypothetical protein
MSVLNEISLKQSIYSLHLISKDKRIFVKEDYGLNEIK